MKRLLYILAFFGLSALGISQIPESLDYQMIIHDETGKIISNQEVSVRISILAGSIEDAVVYSERHTVTTDQSGSVTLPIGKGTDKNGNFSSIDWYAGKYFLKVELDSAGGNNYAEIGTAQILSVPYNKVSKASKKAYQIIVEDKLLISRKYVGQFVDFRQTGPSNSNGPNIIWIKTSFDKTFGKISAFGKKCEFSVGDRLFIKRTYYSPGVVSGYWVYQIENDSSVYYKLTDFQYDNKIFVETWFK
jgi:hypothetical protein